MLRNGDEGDAAASAAAQEQGGAQEGTDDGTQEGADTGIYEGGESESESGTGEGTEESTTEEQGSERTEDVSDKGADDGEAETTSPEGQYTITLPDGMELDEEGAAKFNELGKELGITQEQVDKLVEWYVDRMQHNAGSVEESMKALAEAQSQTWREQGEVVAPEGSPERKSAARAIEQFGSDSLKKWLQESGTGNHPELIRFCVRVGNAVSEDTLETGEHGGGEGPTDHDLQEKGIYA